MLALGQIIDRYEVTELIGRGGMALVYQLRHRSLGSTHALKVLELTSPSIRRRFELEGRVQAGLNHPNVVRVTDTIEVEGAPALVMEFVGGPPLDAYLALSRPDRTTALALFRGICCGVAHAHAAGIVHRDLKPGNVMLAITDHGVLPKVADFGLAKLVAGDDGPAGGRATRTGAAMGTPTYMAPEQLEDAKRVDGRADVYALGVMLYELLCGRPHYVADGLMDTIQARLDGPYERPEVLVPDLPSHLVELIDRMLAEDPDERVGSVREVLERLDGRTFGTETIPPAPPVMGALWDEVRQIERSAPSHEDLKAFSEASAVAPVASEPEAPAKSGAGGRSPLWLGLVVLLLTVGGVSVVGVGGVGLWVALSQEGEGTEVVEPEDGLGDGEDEAAVQPAPAPDPPPDAAPDPRPDLAPAPGPVAAPKAPEPAKPAPPAAPAPPLPEPAPTQRRPTVTIAGEADQVFLRRGGRDYAPTDRLEPGRYAVHAIFDGAAAIQAGEVTLGRGEAVVLSCSASFQTCVVK